MTPRYFRGNEIASPRKIVYIEDCEVLTLARLLSNSNRSISTTAAITKNIRLKMLKKIVFLASIAITHLAHAQAITTCQNPEGYSYHHFYGPVPKVKSGFTKDKITGGMVTLQKVGDGKYDILFVDATKQIISAVGDGGSVTLLRRGKKDVTFVHAYPGKVIELYTFWEDTEGRPKYDIVQSKGGDSMKIHKSSIMIGTCSSINFELIN